MQLSELSEHPVVFFDGVCNLCNASVQFIIRNDQKKRFLFSALDSDRGMAASHIVGFKANTAGSIILLNEGRYYVRSSAALRIAKMLGGAWPLLSVGLVLPRFLRDAVYNFIAANRYRWFGKADHCMVITPELRSRFI